MAALARYSNDDFKAIATNLRGRIRNQEMEQSRTKKRLVALGAGMTAAGGFGYLAGHLAKKAAAESKPDPTMLGGSVPLGVVVGGALSLLTLGGAKIAKGKKLGWLNDAAEAAGSHIAAGAIYHQAFVQAQKA